MVFLEIPNVPKGTVFAEQVTYRVHIMTFTHGLVVYSLRVGMYYLNPHVHAHIHTHTDKAIYETSMLYPAA